VESLARAAGAAVGRPTAIIFSADPPMADRDSTAAFAELAKEAAIVWVVPGGSEGLVSPSLAAGPAVTVIAEHQAVADDICDLLGASPPVSVSQSERGPGAYAQA
jgi:hypothetical protein